MINKNDLRKAISSIAISNAKRNTIYKAFSDLDSITKEEFDSVKSDISKVVESMLTKDTVGKANGVASLDSNGSVPIEQLGNIDTTLFLIVRELPTMDIKTNKIYLVPNQDGQGDNIYVEYLYVEGVWEKLGEFKPEVDITGKADKNETIVEIKRLTGKTGREWNAYTDTEEYSDFKQYLISKGNYCGFYVNILSRPFTAEGFYSNYKPLISFGNGIKLAAYRIHTLHIGIFRDEATTHVPLYEFEIQDNKQSTIIIAPKELIHSSCNEDDGIGIYAYASVEYVNANFPSLVNVGKQISLDLFKSVLAKEPNYTNEIGFISYTNSNNYRVKYADGRYALINTDKNVVIGGKDYNANDNIHAKGFGENGTTFTRGGTLEVNGSATVRDLTTRSITANGSVTINKELNVEKSISTNSTLKAGETTINGTLHCETHDIKTKSVYPAGTGSSSLKDPSLGEVKGNYIVNKGNLGKPAHNYDKLFVENIYWSDCTDIKNEATSLNGDGLVPIYKRQGVSGSPTFYLEKAVSADIEQSSFLYYDKQRGSFCFKSQSEDINEGYSVDSLFYFNTDGTISSKGIGGVRGNGVWYNDYSEDNNIPFEYIKNLYDDEGNGYMSIKNIDKMSFNFDYIRLSAYLDQDVLHGYYKGCLAIESFDTRYEHTNIPKYVCIKATDQILYIESKNGISTSVFATDGSHFDLNKKADLVGGKLKAEQFPKLVNISTASTAEEVVTKFNALLADLKAKGYMETDTVQ